MFLIAQIENISIDIGTMKQSTESNTDLLIAPSDGPMVFLQSSDLHDKPGLLLSLINALGVGGGEDESA